MKKLAAKRRLWSGNGGFEPCRIAQSVRSAVSFDLLMVDLEDFIQRQKNNGIIPTGAHSANF